MVRLKERAEGKLQAFSLPDADVEARSRLVPGLIVLQPTRAGGLQALSQEQKAAQLKAWMGDLEASGQFEYVEPDFVRRPSAAPSDARFVDGTLWGLSNYGQVGGVPGADISATNAWDFTTGSSNVIVAVIDSGVRYTHQDLISRMWRNPDEIPGNGSDDDDDGYIDNIYGIDPANNDGDPMDDMGHGTHVAGTIGAAANDGNPHVGVAWNVRLMALKIGDENGFSICVHTARLRRDVILPATGARERRC